MRVKSERAENQSAGNLPSQVHNARWKVKGGGRQRQQRQQCSPGGCEKQNGEVTVYGRASSLWRREDWDSYTPQTDQCIVPSRLELLRPPLAPWLLLEPLTLTGCRGGERPVRKKPSSALLENRNPIRCAISPVTMVAIMFPALSLARARARRRRTRAPLVITLRRSG
jgi:hypothetical protein